MLDEHPFPTKALCSFTQYVICRKLLFNLGLTLLKWVLEKVSFLFTSQFNGCRRDRYIKIVHKPNVKESTSSHMFLYDYSRTLPGLVTVFAELLLLENVLLRF